MCEVCNDDMQTDSYSLYIFGHIWHGMIDREIIGDRKWGGEVMFDVDCMPGN